MQTLASNSRHASTHLNASRPRKSLPALLALMLLVPIASLEAQDPCANDTTPPVFTAVPADITQTADAGDCGAIVTFTVTATDDCQLDYIVCNYDSGDFFPVGTTTVTCVAIDSSLNASDISFNITITDDEPPAISGTPADINQATDAGLCTAVVTWTEPTASDNCGIASFTADATSGDAFPTGATVVTYTATDVNGNVTTSSFTVTINDLVDPVISGTPADITQTADAGICTTVVNWTEPTATDDCGVTLTSDIAPGTTFFLGTTTVTYTATDPSGNSATASFNVTITDDENPTISGTPADITQNTDAGLCTTAVTWTEPTAADNCPGVSLSSDIASGTAFNLGTTTVTYTATDTSGNTVSTTFNVTVTSKLLVEVFPYTSVAV